MTSAQSAPAPEKVTTPPTSTKHLYCVCELNLPAKTAFCGVTLGPQRLDRRGIAPIELCVICADLAETGNMKCPKCGKKSA